MEHRSVAGCATWLVRRVAATLHGMWGALRRRYRPSWLGLIALLFAVNLAFFVALKFDRRWGTIALGLAVNGSLFVLYRLGERHVGKILVSIAISYFLFAINLFGYRTAIDRYGEQGFFDWFPFAAYGEGSRDHTAVVLLEDRDLKHLKWPWPLPYERHKEILGRIRDARPQALMLDFLFIDALRKDETLGKLVGELQAYRNAGIPVLLAKPVDPDTAVLDELQANAQLVPVPRFVEDEPHNLYPLALYAWTRDGDTEPRWTWRRSAGAEICAVDPTCRTRFLTAAHEAEIDDMVLVWGKPTGCPADRERTRACTFTPTVPVSELMGPRSRADSLLAKRAVFYGAHLAGAPDLVRPPRQEPLAGVYAHAMAFDNLRTYGEHYKREVVRPCPLGRLFRECRLTRVAQGLSVITAPLLFLWSALILRGERSGAWPMVGSLLFYAAATLVYVVGISAYEFTRLDVIPGNWLEGVVEVVVAVSMTDLLAPKLDAYVERLLGARRERES
jgi:hypothetical protein